MSTLWFDALEFDSYGGFISDTQFVREMGQGYLLADGSGKPVESAKTSFTVSEKGMYRFYLRTKNWYVGYEPDCLKIAVDGVEAAQLVGTMQIRGWHFDIGGDIFLMPGKHLLTVSDTTGWFGRFAAVVITNDYDFVPSPEIPVMLKQRLEIKKLPDVMLDEGHYQLVVAGAGAAGVVSAITAARHGLKVALINARPVLGGNSSDEAGVSLDGAACRHYHETGIIYEIKCVREREHIGWSEAFERFVSAEKGISLFQNMMINGADTLNERIKSVYAVNTVKLTHHSFSGDLFIDATGDGWLGYYAGAKYRIGREARFEFDESLAPEASDLNTMSGCIMKKVPGFPANICCYCAKEESREIKFNAPVWACKLPQGKELSREPATPEKGEWWIENRNDYDDLWEQEFVRDELIRISVGYFNWLKNSWEKRDSVKNLALLAIGTFNAKRESRRLIGDYILSQNDYCPGVQFADSVLYSGWNLDVHHIKGIFSGKEGAFTSNTDVPLTPVPFRCLYSKNIGNLMMAGRCISTTHMGMGSTRVQLTTATMGQAVGTAAFLCCRYKADPRTIGTAHIDELQQILLKEGQTIQGIYNHDEMDLARFAEITADSYIKGGEPQNIVIGSTRAFNKEAYAWISKAGLPQSITLSFDSVKEIREIRITAEMPLDRHDFGFQPAPVPTEAIRDFSVEIFNEGQWKQISAIRNNFQRLIVLNYENCCAEKVRVRVFQTFGSDRAIIPEIRIY